MFGRQELDIRLVQQHDRVRRNSPQEPFDIVGRFHGARRIVRPADHHDLCLACRLSHGIQVVVAVLVQRHRHRAQPGHLGEDRVPVKRRRGHHHPVARAGHRTQHLHDHAGRARRRSPPAPRAPRRGLQSVSAAARAGTPGSGSRRRSIRSVPTARAGNGGNGFSLSDNANGFTASGSAPPASVSSRFSVPISRDRPI